jgi:hypothetical protein
MSTFIESDHPRHQSGQFAPKPNTAPTGALGDDPVLVEMDDGSRWWKLDGRRHRVDGPAFIGADGTTAWWLGDVLHRVDGPAIERPDGTKEWWVDGKQHRTDGPAVEWGNGSREWWVDGRRHREDGPAVEWSDNTQVILLDDSDREGDSPILVDVDKQPMWYLLGRRLTEEEHAHYVIRLRLLRGTDKPH